MKTRHFFVDEETWALKKINADRYVILHKAAGLSFPNHVAPSHCLVFKDIKLWCDGTDELDEMV